MKRGVVFLGIGIIIIILLGVYLRVALKNSKESNREVPNCILTDSEKKTFDNARYKYNLTEGYLFCEYGPGEGKNNGSAFLDLSIDVAKEDEYIKFAFLFLEQGDGDQLGIWIDDEMRYVITGIYFENATNPDFTGLVNVDDLTPGKHLMTVALHSYGQNNNSKVYVGGFRMVSENKSLF